MKDKKHISFLAVVLFFAMATTSFAQEQEGLIKRLFFRLRGGKPKRAAVSVEEKAGAVTATAVEAMPSPQDEAVVPAPEERIEEKKPLEEMATEKFVEYIKELLDYEDEVLAAIPELKKEEDGFYTYNEVRLEELDREKLDALYSRIQNELNRIRLERLNAQLESIRQAQQAIRAVQQIQQPEAVARQAQQFQAIHIAAQRAQETNVMVQQITRTQTQMAQQQSQTPPNPPQVPKQPPPPPPPPQRR